MPDRLVEIPEDELLAVLMNTYAAGVIDALAAFPTPTTLEVVCPREEVLRRLWELTGLGPSAGRVWRLEGHDAAMFLWAMLPVLKSRFVRRHARRLIRSVRPAGLYPARSSQAA
jgi:hypothetical protein